MFPSLRYFWEKTLVSRHFKKVKCANNNGLSPKMIWVCLIWIFKRTFFCEKRDNKNKGVRLTSLNKEKWESETEKSKTRENIKNPKWMRCKEKTGYKNIILRDFYKRKQMWVKQKERFDKDPKRRIKKRDLGSEVCEPQGAQQKISKGLYKRPSCVIRIIFLCSLYPIECHIFLNPKSIVQETVKTKKITIGKQQNGNFSIDLVPYYPSFPLSSIISSITFASMALATSIHTGLTILSVFSYLVSHNPTTNSPLNPQFHSHLKYQLSH